MFYKKLITVIIAGLLIQKVLLPYSEELYRSHESKKEEMYQQEISNIISSQGITVFTDDWCSTCKKLEQCLLKESVPYRRIESGTPLFISFYRSRKLTVPTIIINGNIQSGISKREFAKAGYNLSCI